MNNSEETHIQNIIIPWGRTSEWGRFSLFLTAEAADATGEKLQSKRNLNKTHVFRRSILWDSAVSNQAFCNRSVVVSVTQAAPFYAKNLLPSAPLLLASPQFGRPPSRLLRKVSSDTSQHDCRVTGPAGFVKLERAVWGPVWVSWKYFGWFVIVF